MKKLLTLLLIVVAFIGCKKSNGTEACTQQDSGVVATTAEINFIRSYCNINAPTAIQHSSGVFYDIVAPGTGASPNLCSKITVAYAGYIMSASTPFDSPATPQTFTLSALIDGWKKILPLIKAGGIVRLYIPPSLGYGNTDVKDANGNVIIPAGSYLRFQVQLNSVQ